MLDAVVRSRCLNVSNTLILLLRTDVQIRCWCLFWRRPCVNEIKVSVGKLRCCESRLHLALFLNIDCWLKTTDWRGTSIESARVNAAAFQLNGILYGSQVPSKIEVLLTATVKGRSPIKCECFVSFGNFRPSSESFQPRRTDNRLELEDGRCARHSLRPKSKSNPRRLMSMPNSTFIS